MVLFHKDNKAAGHSVESIILNTTCPHCREAAAQFRLFCSVTACRNCKNSGINRQNWS